MAIKSTNEIGCLPEIKYQVDEAIAWDSEVEE